MSCKHLFVDGFGGMGDAVVCVKCGYSKYPEALGIFDRLFRKVIKNNGRYGHQNEFPYVVVFPTSIGWNTNWDSWTHYFNKGGEIVPRSQLDQNKVVKSR